jgi:glutamate/aspartate transport system permease protein
VVAFDQDTVLRGLPFLASGLLFSLKLTGVAGIGGALLGATLASARLMGGRCVRTLARIYVDLLRSVPLVLVLFWFYFLLPLLAQMVLRIPYPVPISAESSAAVTFVLFEAAYFCEILRAGIQSIPKGQVDAARALGLSRLLTFRLVILPQAVRKVVPIALTQLIVLFQDTSLVYVLSITDLVGAASKLAQRDAKLMEMYSCVAVTFLAICLALSAGVAILQRRLLPEGARGSALLERPL